MVEHHHVEEIAQVLDGHPSGRDSYVDASWRRCVELYGMDPTRSDPAHIVTDAEFRAHREQADWMIGAARSGLQSLFRQVAGQNYVLLLTDAKGVCVDFFGDDLFLDELRRAGLYLGSNWSEELAGTCGVGACIVTGEPVTVHQDDHFGNAHTLLSCTSAPIFDSLGQLAAVLDISLLRSPSPKSSQNLAMSLVTAAARRVEMANLMAASRREWVLRFSSSPEFLDVDPEAAVSLDGSGRVIGATRAATQMLSRGDSLIGRRIDTLLGLSVDDLPDLMRDRPTEERVVALGDGGAVFGHAIAPQAPRRSQTNQGSTSRHARGGVLSALAGSDPTMGRLLAQAERLAPTHVPLLICGESGSGKTKLARAIHMASRRGGFVSVDCAGAQPEDLRQALAAQSGPGTLLLRHIEDLPPDTARVLAGLLDAHPDLRPISTSATAPSDLVSQDKLPATLYFRLSGSVLDIPPLRERQDLGWLLERLLRRHCGGEMRLTPSARAELLAREWPGNLRELGNVLDVACALAESTVIDLPDLPDVTETRDKEQDLEAVLDACDWNMARAARRLGVNRSTVLRRIRKQALRAPD
ncbi:sigma-54-dependent Fis family transcriptional regulator [Pseudosulfitobacter pseudonitzschiae]|uniref:sigma-54-dependent Fis family transcriptional regulator n=1 Tax=Pseudosulfitobacter pseudonitzschiae TaxID=1402135 RepID=UPI001AF9C411|nr:sigma-54-dependent Fis family transcriptional regulator [Pseudosulfitobacter pseudonitzschiae]MBM1816318.1 sigma-54-dependent Fis family transcriptional regulator [Pseudosulfitobacter pseudonitzschiae]MBM1833831.1 sigma-54-dependent Fis family transcriptional regulator [Pseudosulfitobacter pseudonitzschiae]MBM1838697.1 sigma-54-dependent Fis family transcriptional regulator [Pseudosulfitobacter pseudonitzschiae]MBM1843045.1 sigma-54-dependent Fis family transcriptional regulator [Pseudosulfi